MQEIESLYRQHCSAGTAISPHLPRLRELAEGLDTVVEFGVKRGASTTALLLGAKRVVSFDVVETPQARALQAVAGDRWDYRLEDSRNASIPECQMMFIDSLHTFDQVDAECQHADKASQYIVFHDVSTFGEVGAMGETGRQSWNYVAGRGSVPMEHRGIRPAIDDLMIRDPSWRIIERRVESHGLLVLERQ
jgi:hypothetical protein